MPNKESVEESVKKRIKRTMQRLKEDLDKGNYINGIFHVTLLSLEIQEAFGEQRSKPGYGETETK